MHAHRIVPSAALVALVALASACSGGAPPPTPVVIPFAMAAGGPGSACVTNADCTDGLCDRTVPGGYCTAACDPTDPAACGDDGYCDGGFCLQRCQAQRECRSAEFECYGIPDEDFGVCGFIVADAIPAAPNIGSPCRADLECAAPGELRAVCIPAFDFDGEPTGYADGQCVAIPCDGDGACGDGAVCVGDAPATYCAPACPEGCEGDACGCREGYVCDDAACVPDRFTMDP